MQWNISALLTLNVRSDPTETLPELRFFKNTYITKKRNLTGLLHLQMKEKRKAVTFSACAVTAQLCSSPCSDGLWAPSAAPVLGLRVQEHSSGGVRNGGMWGSAMQWAARVPSGAVPIEATPRRCLPSFFWLFVNSSPELLGSLFCSTSEGGSAATVTPATQGTSSRDGLNLIYLLSQLGLDTFLLLLKYCLLISLLHLLSLAIACWQLWVLPMEHSPSLLSPELPWQHGEQQGGDAEAL